MTELGRGLLSRIRGRGRKDDIQRTTLMQLQSVKEFAALCNVQVETLLANGDGLNPLNAAAEPLPAGGQAPPEVSDVARILSLKFDPTDGLCVRDQHDPDCRWARVSVANSGRTDIRDCRAYVINVEKEDGSDWRETHPKFADRLALEWGATVDPKEKYKPRTIHRKEEFFINVLYSGEENPRLMLTVQDPNWRYMFFTKHGRYLITITVTGEEVETNPPDIKVIITWTGEWKFDTELWTPEMGPEA